MPLCSDDSNVFDSGFGELADVWRGFFANLSFAWDEYADPHPVGVMERIAAHFVFARRLALALCWLPALLGITVIGTSWWVIKQLLPFVGVGFMLWLGYSMLIARPAPHPVWMPPEVPRYIEPVEPYPPTGFPAEAESALP